MLWKAASSSFLQAWTIKRKRSITNMEHQIIQDGRFHISRPKTERNLPKKVPAIDIVNKRRKIHERKRHKTFGDIGLGMWGGPNYQLYVEGIHWIQNSRRLHLSHCTWIRLAPLAKIMTNLPHRQYDVAWSLHLRHHPFKRWKIQLFVGKAETPAIDKEPQSSESNSYFLSLYWKP